MAFERLRQQQEAEEIARQQKQKAKEEADRVAEQKRIEALQQKETTAKRERDRIEAERQKTLAFRQQSGIVDKLIEFATLIQPDHKDKVEPDLDNPDYRSTSSSIVDRVVWNRRFEKRREDRWKEGKMHWIYKSSHEEEFLIAETFPDGTIYIRGNILASFFGIGSKKLSLADWNQRGVSRPDVFEEPIYNAYQIHATKYDTFKHEVESHEIQEAD